MSKTPTITVTTEDAYLAVKSMRTRIKRLEGVRLTWANIVGNGTKKEVAQAEKWISSHGYESSTQVQEEISNLRSSADRMQLSILDTLH